MLHHTRVSIEADFGELVEEHSLREKLAALEELCEAQGVADGDAADAVRCAPPRCCGLAAGSCCGQRAAGCGGGDDACKRLRVKRPVDMPAQLGAGSAAACRRRQLSSLPRNPPPSRQPALGPTNAIRLGMLRAKQAEAEQLRGVLAAVEAANGGLQAQLDERRRQAGELLAKTQVQRCWPACQNRRLSAVGRPLRVEQQDGRQRG